MALALAETEATGQDPVAGDQAKCASLSSSVLRLVAVSGFTADASSSLHATCLELCKAQREACPLRRFRVRYFTPQVVLRLLQPNVPDGSAQPSSASRVPPYKKVLRLEWDETDYFSHSNRVPARMCFRNEERWSNEEEGCYDDEAEGSDGMLRVEDLKLMDRGLFPKAGTWAASARDLVLRIYDGPIDRVVWPQDMERLAFGCDDFGGVWTHAFCLFDQPLDRVSFPVSLRELLLGCCFDQRIDGVTWPDGLERLSMPGYTFPLDGIRWPANLASLEFSRPNPLTYEQKGVHVAHQGCERKGFNKPLSNSLPPKLTKLTLGDQFRQPLADVTWPSGLVEIGFGANFPGDFLSGVDWPPTLRHLFLKTPAPNGYGDLPHACRVFELEGDPEDLDNIGVFEALQAFELDSDDGAEDVADEDDDSDFSL